MHAGDVTRLMCLVSIRNRPRRRGDDLKRSRRAYRHEHGSPPFFARTSPEAHAHTLFTNARGHSSRGQALRDAFRRPPSDWATKITRAHPPVQAVSTTATFPGSEMRQRTATNTATRQRKEPTLVFPGLPSLSKPPAILEASRIQFVCVGKQSGHRKRAGCDLRFPGDDRRRSQILLRYDGESKQIN